MNLNLLKIVAIWLFITLRKKWPDLAEKKNFYWSKELAALTQNFNKEFELSEETGFGPYKKAQRTLNYKYYGIR